jgi:demethylmenaquinone methyltransferase/2-methoxy-6-polyprenyl-1,4-benzoquinol methylase
MADQPSGLDAQPLDKSERRIREMFGEISPRYDFLNHFLSGGTDIYWRWRTVRAVPPEGAAPILDVCTGTGDLALAWWKRTGGRVQVVGADFTPQMLVLAEQKLARYGNAKHEQGSRRRPGQATIVDRGSAGPGGQGDAAPLSLAGASGSRGGLPVVFVGADAQRLPFPDDIFQIVSVAFGLRNVTDTDQGLREMVRVCRPGGRVAILEFSMPRNRLLRAGYRFYFRRILPRIGRLLSGNRHSAYSYLPASVEEFPQGAALAARLEAAGLTAVTWKPLTFGVATLYVGRKEPSVVSGPWSAANDRSSSAATRATQRLPAQSPPATDHGPRTTDN